VEVLRIKKTNFIFVVLRCPGHLTLALLTDTLSWGYLYSKLPEEKIKERMDYFKDQVKQLMEIRKSGNLSENKI
jgi:hypothetical protein